MITTPTPLSILWTETAAEELEKRATYISDTNPSAASKWLDDIESAVDSLPLFPLRCRAGRYPNTRELSVNKYIVVYDITETNVRILRVVHSSQDW